MRVLSPLISLVKPLIWLSKFDFLALKSFTCAKLSEYCLVASDLFESSGIFAFTLNTF